MSKGDGTSSQTDHTQELSDTVPESDRSYRPASFRASERWFLSQTQGPKNGDIQGPDTELQGSHHQRSRQNIQDLFIDNCECIGNTGNASIRYQLQYAHHTTNKKSTFTKNSTITLTSRLSTPTTKLTVVDNIERIPEAKIESNFEAL